MKLTARFAALSLLCLLAISADARRKNKPHPQLVTDAPATAT